MTNSWVDFVKKYSKQNNISYGCAVSKLDCKNKYQEYKKSTKGKNIKNKLNNLNEYTKFNKNNLKSESSMKYKYTNKPTMKDNEIFLDKENNNNNNLFKNAFLNRVYENQILKKRN